MTFFQAEKRRTVRVNREVDVQISGMDPRGMEFIFQTKTLVLSRHGAQIATDQELAPEQEINVFCPITGKDGRARVTSAPVKGSDNCTYGIEFLDPDLNVWNVVFSPAPGIPC